jgi:1,2-phenylacetyl-CoA epoxidase catalytic subunit
MDVETFLSELDGEINAALDRIGAASQAGAPAEGLTVARLLQVALKNELEATEEAALWITRERDVDVKLALARQCGDEARHYRLIAERLGALGVDTTGLDPLAQGKSPMFDYLAGLETTVERVAAGQFTREALAGVRNLVFIEFCEASGDPETARLYRENIQPDERHHHELGRRLLFRLATTPEAQQLARQAALRTLALAEELQQVARLKLGLTRAPGC